MADLGAEVRKIETPGRGDPSRTAGQVEGYPSSYFETNNRGVKSLTLNLKDPRALDILYKLVAEADIFGQNFRPGAAERNGFGYEDLKKINPKLVYASISGYGPDGPHAALPGTDRLGSTKWSPKESQDEQRKEKKSEVQKGKAKNGKEEWKWNQASFLQGRWGGEGRPRSPQEAPSRETPLPYPI